MRAKPPKPKKEPKTLGNYVDVFVKRMFSRIVVIVDFLMFYADPNFVSEIDLTRIKPAPTHYIGKTRSSEASSKHSSASTRFRNRAYNIKTP